MVIAVSIVEDDVEARTIFAGWIKRAPEFRLVGEWGDAESAIESLPKLKPDVALMDINLPGMSGVEAVQNRGGGRCPARRAPGRRAPAGR